MKLILISLFFSITLSFQAYAGEARVYLCGFYTSANKKITLNNEREQVVDVSGLELSENQSGCFIGKELPVSIDGNLSFFATAFKYLPLRTGATPSAIQPGAIGVCGLVIVKVQTRPALQLSATVEIELASTPQFDPSTNIKESSASILCAEGSRLPEVDQAGILTFQTEYLRNDLSRSGVSIGNQ